MNPRNGKIARLPQEIHEELNQRLELSEQGPQLLAWLNALQEVKKVVQDHFDGVLISKQNLSEWRQGGFQEWLIRRDLCQEAREVTRLSNNMGVEDSRGVLADDVAMVLTARFGSLIMKWDGEVDAKFEAKTRVLNRLCRSVVQLQHGMHRACKEDFERQRLAEEQEKREDDELKEKLTAPFFNALKVGPLAEMFGGGTAGRKIAKYVTAVRSGKLDAEFDVLPTDKFGEPEPEPEESDSAKPEQAGETEPEDEDKPLEENEMEGVEESDSSRDQSDSVIPSQTDLAPEEDEGVRLGLGLRTDETDMRL